MDSYSDVETGDCWEINHGRYSRRPNADGGRISLSRALQPISNRNQKFTNHIRTSPVEVWQGKENLNIPSSSAIRQDKTTGKRYPARFEQATIDPATLMVLCDMLNRAIFDDINGCISTGNIANVYHATKLDGQEFAIKVYKASGFLKFGPTKMVRTCADNDMCYLKRLKEAGIRCPTPISSRLHVLVMEFIGKSGRAAPRLKDANLSKDQMRECYVQMIMVMRDLYHKCKLVHGYLSGENILYYEGNLHIIDVSESVDFDHPDALDLLRRDCNNVSNFFKKNGVPVVAIRELVAFIVDSSDESVDSYLEEVRGKILAWDNEMSKVIFKKVDDTTNGGAQENPWIDFFLELATDNHTGDQTNDSGTDENSEVDDDDSSDSKAVEPCDTTNDGTQETLPGDKKAARKENKKKVKGEKREARRTKSSIDAREKKKKLMLYFLGSKLCIFYDTTGLIGNGTLVQHLGEILLGIFHYSFPDYLGLI
ncbi:hypothetical protein MKW94_018005 [Papaver nudicaule]|uniref:non-specific serine/threonine protein kinase n=1 Tax=Papaver nudicaule TaxID=74823 RepID=A0AA42B642_PAPNU|nr:hypothetical protein [Papaver nudicaule]